MAKKSAEKPGPEGNPVTIKASNALRIRLKIYAARSGQDMREVTDQALDEYLKKRGA
jgi:predicted transcriptional regulator